MRPLVSLTLILTFLPLAAGTPPSGRVLDADYVGVTGDTVPACFEPSEFGLGMVCFTPRASEDSVTLWVDDVTDADVGGQWIFETANGARLAQGNFCARTQADIPAEAARLRVRIYTAFGMGVCGGVVPLQGRTGSGIEGRVTAFFQGDA